MSFRILQRVALPKFRKLLADESGATAIEYGLISSLIFLVIVGAVHNFSDTLMITYQKINTAVSNANATK